MISREFILFSVFGLALLTVALTGSPAQAQIRIQGLPLNPEEEEAPLAPIVNLIDYREEMRLFIQNISSYARSHNPNFVVIAKDAMELLEKQDDIDEARRAPARTYMRSIDGIMQEGLFITNRPYGVVIPPERQRELLRLAEHAKQNGLKVLALDFGNSKEAIDSARQQAESHGFLSLVSDGVGQDIRKLPTYPSRPPHENPNSILALDQVRNFATIRNSAPYGQQAQFALKMHDTNYDALLVEVYHGRTPLTRRAVETLKYKKLGSRRLVFAYMNIGIAASHQYYWKADWKPESPKWIVSPHRNDPDSYVVEYWQTDWQSIIYGNPQSYMYGIIAQGFDGVILDGANAYQNFERDVDDE